MKSVISTILAFAVHLCYAQMLSPKEAKEDLKLLNEILKAAHPGLYRYQTETQWQQSFEEVMDINDSISTVHFNYLIRYLLKNIQCGHTTSYIPRRMRMARLNSDELQVPPLLLAWDKGRMFVTKSMDSNLPENVELLVINGHSIDSLVKAWSPYSFQGDGGSSTRTPYFIADEFHLYYNDLVEEDTSYLLEFKTNDNDTTQRIIVGSISASSWREQRKSMKDALHKSWLSYTVTDEDIAILRIRMFGDYELQNGEKGKFKKFIASTFKEMKQTSPKALIIDLRENTGGEGKLGAMFYGMIAKAPFQYFDRWETNVNRIPFEEKADISKLEKAAINGLLKKRLQPSKKGYTVKSWFGTLTIQEPDELAYDGPVYVLSDGRTFSAASDFIAVAEHNNRVVVVGETTGGASVGNNSGVTINYLLPNSQLRVQIPLAAGYNNVNQRKLGGITPNYEVNPSDALEFTLDLIRN